MRGRMLSWVFRAVVLWGAQRLIRWFADKYGDDHRDGRPGAGGPQKPKLIGRTGTDRDG